jgi:hypothetical protein
MRYAPRVLADTSPRAERGPEPSHWPACLYVNIDLWPTRRNSLILGGGKATGNLGS